MRRKQHSLGSRIPGKIVLTGGHAATTAVAVVEEIKKESKDWKLYWVGVRNAIEGKKVVTLESEVLPRLEVEFLPITAGRLQRRFTFWTIPSIFKVPIGFIQSFIYLMKIKPGAVLSFGGFASFPVVICARILGIPVIIHEQTSAAGRANLMSAKFATKITLARVSSKKYFPSDKTEIIGNPIMKDIKNIKPFKDEGEIPVIYVTGGSRGSQNINVCIEKILKTLLTKYKVIHQTGGIDYLKFSALKQKMPEALRVNYEVFIRINPLEVSHVYEKAWVIVSRAGANTVSEIMQIKRPSILIPLPISYLDEQTKNAKIARDFGIAEIILQHSLTPEKLLSAINKMVDKASFISGSVRNKIAPDSNASEKLVNIIAEYLK